MRIPATVKIGASRYRVIQRADTWRDDGKDIDYLGQAKYGSQEILIALADEGRPLPEASIADTFLHEILHSISRTYGIDLSENQVAGIAGGLLQVIRDSKLDFRK